jgi:hypothetical protein
MEKPKAYAREVLYRDASGLIEVVLLTNKIAGGCSHKVYLKRAGLQVGPNMFLGHVAETDTANAHAALTDEVKGLAKAAMLACYVQVYKGGD